MFKRESRREQYRVMHRHAGPYCSRSCASKSKRTYDRVAGREHPNSILTENDVRRIRRQLKYGVPVKNIMILTGMSENCIRSIQYRKTWKHVKDYAA
tara:strand:+ start:3080 stop:3370 length:291 start_codon:yes stop_codon:yes gene_type:complete